MAGRPEPTTRPTASTITDPELDRLYARLRTLTDGAAERSAILEEARDALEQAGEPGAHGDDWPRLAPSIRSLAANRDRSRGRLDAVDALAAAWQRPDMSPPTQAAGRHLRAVLDGGEQPGPDGERELRPCGQPTCLPNGAHRYMLGGRIHHCPGANTSPDATDSNTTGRTSR